MGAYAPTPIYTNELAQIVKKTVLEPTISGMRRDGYPFIGVLYIGLMITSTGPKVVEYNCRFGDPETQVILPLLDDSSDLCDIMMACCEGRLDSVSVSFSNDFAVTIVMSSKGYPGKYSTGIPIEISESDQNCLVYHAGTKKINKSLVTNGGRVLSVTATSKTLSEALSHAYSGIKGISFEGSHYRKDIGAKALSYKQKSTTYADAGVSITHGNNLVDMIKPLVKSTSRIGSDAIIGGFGGLFDVKAAGFVDAVLVSGTDGVGTKLIIAQEIGIHDTIGIDLVAMSVNDVLVQGAEPLFFLDYFACSVLDVNVARDVVAGIVKGYLFLI